MINNYIIDEVKVSFPDNLEEMKKLFDCLLDENKNLISFINPEIFMQQKKSALLHSYFNKCKYNFVDGVGLLYAINKKCNTKFDTSFRFPGTDFFTYLPNEREIKVFLYGSKLENIVKAKEKIEETYKNIQIVDYFDGYTVMDDDNLIEKINNSRPDILIVCLGCPKQEMWIEKNYERLNAKIIFGNGGSIDFWSGAVKRAPQFFINHGIEFIYRLFQNFTIQRIKRQLKLFNFLFNYKFGKYTIYEDNNLTQNVK